MAGEPKFLHPATENKTNLDVARVFTVIDPRKALPEAVNVRFDSGEIRRIGVSSPWMPPVCGHCNELGHGIRHCRSAPVLCSNCNSKVHKLEECTRGKKGGDRSSTDQGIPKLAVSHGPEQIPKASQDREGTKRQTGLQVEKEIKHADVNQAKDIEISSGLEMPPPCAEMEKAGSKATENASTSKPARKGSTHTSSKKGVTQAYRAKLKEVSSNNEASDAEFSDVSATDYDQEEFHTVLTRRQKKEGRGKSLKPLV